MHSDKVFTEISPKTFMLTQQELRLAKLFMPAGFTLVSKNKMKQTLARTASHQTHQAPTLPPPLKQETSIRTNKENNQPPRGPRGRTSFGSSHLVDSPSPTGSINKRMSMQKAVPQKKPKSNLPPELQKWLKIVTSLKKNKVATPFLYPVDTTLISDYLTVIKEPMDLDTIQKNIHNGRYTTFAEFVLDLKKIWFNAYQYNPKGSNLYKMAIQMETTMNKLLQDLNPQPVPPKQIPPPKMIKQNPPPPPPVAVAPKPAPKPAAEPKKRSTNMADIPMTIQQKRLLGQSIKKLPHQYLRGVWEIVSSCLEDQSSLEFDIQTLPVRKTRELQSYIKEIMIQIQNKKDKASTMVQNQNMQSDEESSFIMQEDED